MYTVLCQANLFVFGNYTCIVQLYNLTYAQLSNLQLFTQLVMCQVVLHVAPGGLLRYISDGDVRSPFLGLKFAI